MSRVRQLAASDLERLHAEHGDQGPKYRWLVHPSLIACLLVRVRTCGGAAPAFLAHWLLLSIFGIDIGRTAVVGAGLLLPHPVGVVVGAGARIGAGATLYQRTTVGKGRTGRLPVLEDRVTLLPGAVVAGECRIGAAALVGANAVVVADVPAGTAVYAPRPVASRGDTEAWKP